MFEHQNNAPLQSSSSELLAGELGLEELQSLSDEQMDRIVGGCALINGTTGPWQSGDKCDSKWEKHHCHEHHYHGHHHHGQKKRHWFC